MKKTTLVLSAALLLGGSMNAQTEDITVILAPSAGYTFWNKNLNLGQSPFWGVRAGFSVGPIVEIRGIYERSFDLKGKLQGAGWSVLNNLGNDLTGSKAKVQRIGGELKLNVWSNALLTPYITAGAGVMKFNYDDPSLTEGYKEEQLYTALGAGLKINLAKRIALALEAKNHIFNVNENNRYLAAGASSDKALQNWTAQASLDFYLGGRKYSDDAVARAFRSYYGNGFKGLKFVLEPGFTYLDFHSDSFLHDSYMLGGSAGIDFGQYLGIRGFYYQTTNNPDKLSLSFGNDLRMYGGNLITRLNVARGVTPYLNLGAGYLQVADDYIDTKGTNLAKSGWFALGGAGLEVPLHRNLALYGQVNAMLNEQDNSDLSKTAPAEVKINLAMQAGLRINLGKRSESGINMYQRYATSQVEAERNLNNERINELRSSYDTRIDSLNRELTLALEKRAEIEVVDSIDKLPTPLAETTTTTAQPSIQTPQGVYMSEAQLEAMLERIARRIAPSQSPVQMAQPQQSTQGLSDFDRLLLLMAAQNKTQDNSYRVDTIYRTQLAPTTTKSNRKDDNIDRQLEAIENRLDRRMSRLEELLTSSARQSQQPVVVKVEGNKGSNSVPSPSIHYITTPAAPAQALVQQTQPQPVERIVRDTVYQTQRDTLTITETKDEVHTLYFANGSSRLDVSSTSALYALADRLRANPDLEVVIRGYASPEGSESRNRALAEARRRAVQQVLVERGVSPRMITVDNNNYIDQSGTDARLARRVVIEVLR
ncbi:MAG: outer membrane beta-barrel protein [Porphyromonas sp.]|nr:outer membrane beta-barrel protein [Porphyromonas sp.]